MQPNPRNMDRDTVEEETTKVDRMTQIFMNEAEHYFNSVFDKGTTLTL